MPHPVLDGPSRPRFMEPGDLAPLIERFAAHLSGLGHTDFTVDGYRASARHFAVWLDRSGIALNAVDGRVVARFADHRCQCLGNRRQDRLSRKYVNRVRRFVHFLAATGAVSLTEPEEAASTNALVTEFLDWQRRHRGLRERTIMHHRSMILRLLPELGEDPAVYDAGLIRRVVLAMAQANSSVSVRAVTAALRAYLRFLAARGACQPWLDQAVPTIPQWRVSTMPRYLPKADIERLISSCDLTKPHGVRDHAILLLMARLGLRAGDIADMRLDDIAWAQGTLRVRGKSRRETDLPLPQDAGDALLDYLERTRPTVDVERVFLRSVAPFRPLNHRSTVSSIVRTAIRRAGIADPPSSGAHLLRHSAATSMLREGATLEAIGAVLRHSSPDTTAHYAKVDFAMLRQVVQPWPEAWSC